MCKKLRNKLNDKDFNFYYNQWEKLIDGCNTKEEVLQAMTATNSNATA